MGDAILDPVLFDSIPGLARRVRYVEQAPKVVSPIPLVAVPRVAVSAAANWDYTMAAAGGFVTVWETLVPVLPHTGLACEFADYDSGGADGEVRVVMTRGAETATSSVRTHLSGFGAQAVLGWLHNLAPWAAGTVTISFQARKTAGAGSYVVGRPQMTLLNDRACTTAGAWYAGVWLPQ